MDNTEKAPSKACNNLLPDIILTREFVITFLDIESGKFKKNLPGNKYDASVVNNHFGKQFKEKVIHKAKVEGKANTIIFLQHNRNCRKVLKVSFNWSALQSKATTNAKVADNGEPCSW